MNDSPTPPEAPEPPLAAPSPTAIREMLTEMVVKDLLGPAGGPEEELFHREAHVYGRYLVGMLAPVNSELPAAELDELASADGDEGEEGGVEDSVPAGATYLPSSMGLSFTVDAAAAAVEVEASWGQYLRITSESQRDLGGEPVKAWKRREVAPPPVVLPLAEGPIAARAPHAEHPGVVLKGRARMSDAGWVVTLFLMNGQEARQGRAPAKDEMWVFQPVLRVRGVDGAAVFTHHMRRRMDLSRVDPLTREETETLNLLYRRQREFAVGHGVAVHATVDPGCPERAVAVETVWIPRFDVPQQTPRSAADDPNLAGVTLDMRALAEMPREALVANLERIAAAYGIWIEAERAKVADPAEQLGDHAEAAERALRRCARAQARIAEGIALVASDPVAEEAFRFANAAMWKQRIHSILARQVRKGQLPLGADPAPLDVPENRSWRLFQLAFVLLNLPSLTRLDHPDRSHETEAVADLLWFATGGGKTEAYLGLTAYTLAMRRLQGEVGGRDGAHGVAVIMRYTLRLLTLQQFQRAAALLCACEVIRREDEATWGKAPFRLGLWVGNKTTPNTLAAAANVLREKNAGGAFSRSGTPHQLTSCPWCGSEIRSSHLRVYEAPRDVGRCVTYCGDDLGRCAFGERQAPREGLPVMVVDEEIYRRPPALLIATVDKFAQMPWKGETQMLFGRVSGVCDRHGFLSPEIDDAQSHSAARGLPAVRNRSHGFLRPPDLIIQDELHLISGPLGSMVGLYESAIDELCSWEVNGAKVRPKVVASTATIRRAPDQVRRIFVRALDVFPPQGTDIRDSFFALQRPVDETRPGRRYLGISAFGRRYPVAMIRSFVAHMAAAQFLYERYGRAADPWMTLAGYFNSIRELAGTRRLVEDDIRSRLRDADQRGLAKRRVRFGAVEELTSRKSASDIPKLLERLEAVFDPALDAQRDAARKEGGRPGTQSPFDVVLATNMISVGVDIERLGLMVVAGQPKNTSEYIQATSRVGRSGEAPGLICTVYNWARPRDLSHYERFEHYHETFYKHVEALSVTPFASRALDRGLSGVYVALMRLWSSHLNANLDAGKVEDQDPLWAHFDQVLRERGTNSSHDRRVGEQVGVLLKNRREEWLQRVHRQTDHQVGYQAKGGTGTTVALLQGAGAGKRSMFTCLNSLRDVEGTVKLVLDTYPRGMRLDTGGNSNE